ncbi:HU family DNA-binding protein [Scytonema sp. NUACC26]|uniref:HU family DNA-binding protein n=1 Tax=Scytonema sp. NUACC26 TaxID=3140176 RepID=UPI0038B2D62B
MLAEFNEPVASYKMRFLVAQLFKIIKAVSVTEDVKIKGFGTFSKVTVAERTIRNTITAKLPEGEVTVPEHDCPKFIPSDAYRSLLRYGHEVSESEAA